MTDELERIYQAYDEEFYDIAVGELKSGLFSEALWSKALTKASFDETKAKGVYVDLRVEQLKSDISLEQATIEAKEEAKVLEEKGKALEAEGNALEAERKILEVENKKIERELDELKTEILIQDIFSSPLLMLTFLFIAGVAGIHQKSWIIFGVVFSALVILTFILKIKNMRKSEDQW